MTVQILEIGGRDMAVLPKADYERLLALVEDQGDRNAAEQAEVRRAGGEDYLPVDMVDRLLAGENALRLWRTHRKLTLDALGKRAGVGKSVLSELENGRYQGKPALWRRLANALDVTVDDILPDQTD